MRELIEKHIFSSEIKKSRFIAQAVPVKTPEEALSTVGTLSDLTATHNCWAFRIGEKYRFSDDGEPGGTAGRPILSAIEKQDIDNCLVVVTRFFGGIKLGAGGLVRAYSGAAAECLRTASTREVRIFSTVRLAVPFDAIGDVYNVIRQFDANKTNETYGTDGVYLTMTLPEDDKTLFEQKVTEATRGRAHLDWQ